MPPLERQNKLRSFIQLANQSLTRSEFTAAFQRVVKMVRLAEENLTARIDAKLTELKSQVKDGAPGPRGPKGETVIGPMGPQGPQGIQGLPGINADTKVIRETVIEQVIPDITDTIEKHLPALGAAIRNGLELLQGDERLEMSAIKGLDEALAAHAKNFLGNNVGGGTTFTISQLGVKKVQQPIALNFKGAGAPTITTDQGGVTHLDFPSSSGGFTRLTATGTVNGVNTTFTFVSKPVYIIADGAWLLENTGWTWSGLTATMSVPPQTNIFGFA